MDKIGKKRIISIAIFSTVKRKLIPMNSIRRIVKVIILSTTNKYDFELLTTNHSAQSWSE